MNNITPNLRNNWLSLVGFILICLLVFGFGGLFKPEAWYANLNKAPWTPPNIAFPIAWSFLYLCIAVVGWQTFHSNKLTLKRLWASQIVINALWSWVFFGQHWILVGLVVLVILDALVINLALKTRREGLLLSSILLAPYIAWLLLATSLNTYIYMAN